jgi:hypothetical protein
MTDFPVLVSCDQSQDFQHDQLTNINFCCLVRLSGNETNLKTGVIKTLGGIQMLNFAASAEMRSMSMWS